MSIPMQLLLVVAAFCVCFSEGAPDGRIARAKQQRPTRGFKNLEMMTARGFGKRGRPSPRTEPDDEDPALLQRTYRIPVFKTTPKFAYANGKRTAEMEPEALEANFGDHAPLQRTYRTPTFKSSTQNYAYGHGKRSTEIESKDAQEAAVDQSTLDRTYSTPSFNTKSRNFAYGPGKRATEKEFEGDFEDELLPERQRTAVPATHVFKTSVPAVTARDYEKRMPEIVPEESYRRYNPKSSMMVATDFGKRSYDETSEEEEEYRMRRTDFKSKNIVRVAIGYGKREPIKRVYGLDNFWETLASPEREGQEMDDEKLESIPMDWFVNEIVNNPDFARSVLRKFVDINQDGMLSSDELLRNV